MGVVDGFWYSAINGHICTVHMCHDMRSLLQIISV